jgi:type IV pilus assembly protein PilY1
MDFLRVGSSSFAKPPYYVSGMVFRNVEIPRGAIIISARLKVCAHTDHLTDITFGKIEAESADNVESFSISRNIASLPRTNASVHWDIIEPWSPDTWYESPDIADVIQEIIDRDGWSADNSLAIIYSSRSESGYRNFSSYDRSSDYAPRLEITYIP